MPEECRTLAVDPRSSRAATVSEGGGPKSTRKRSRDPANSTGLSLEGWRRYAQFCPWPRGRHGRGRRRRGMSAMEVAQSMSMISGASRRSQRPCAFDHPAWDEEGVGELGLPPEPLHPDWGKEGEGALLSPEEQLVWDAATKGLNLQKMQDDFVLTGHWPVFAKRRRLDWSVEGHDLFGDDDWGIKSAEEDVAVKPFFESRVTEDTSDIKSLETLEELGTYSECELAQMDVSNVTKESRPAEGHREELVDSKADSEIALAKRTGVEEPLGGNDDNEIAIDEPTPAEGVALAKTGGEIASKESRPELVDGKADSEIALAKRRGVEEPLGGNDDNEIAIYEPTPAEGVALAKTGGEIASKESRPEEGYLEKPMVGKTDAEIALAKRWLPLRYPAYPSTGKFDDFLKYTEQAKMIREHNKAGFDRTKNLPTRRVESVDETKDPVKCEEKDVWLKAGKSVVAVSSVGPDHDTTLYCSGVIISCDEEGIVRVLTSSGILYSDDDELHSLEQKVFVKLSNGRKYQGEILYVSKHYNLAILKVCVGSSMPILGFGSMPRYVQRVIALGRDSMDLLIKDGFISTLERTALGRTHYMFPKSASGFPVICTGGPVIDEDGAMVGIITCHVPEAAMMSVSIVQICIDMWEKYSCIARPDISMNLRTVKMLPTSEKDKVQCLYNIREGFIIDGVEYDSTPEKVGIREGDVVEIVNENCGFTLPELETFLLKQGLRFLPKVEGLSSTQELELKIRVHDLVEMSSTSASLSIPVVFEVALP